MKWWAHADIGYFSQLSEEVLNPDDTVLQTLTRAANHDVPAERILAAAGAFLFRNDDLEKPCRVLSGGERARLRLARLILQEHNVLILDEPTNHLDTETVEVLAEALKKYQGTVIIVCHARTFMNTFIDRIYEVQNGAVRYYPGTYEEYVSDLTAEAETASRNELEEKNNTGSNKEKALLIRQLNRVQDRLNNKIKKLDKEKSQILIYFFENSTDYSPEKSRRLAEIDEEINKLEKEWLEIEKTLVG
jgi:ATP-binding cassette subfamily F protein 3